MFRDSNSTVFILGAGASWHYGYPTGETLVEKVIEKAEVALKYFEHSVRIGNPEVPEYLADRNQWVNAVQETKKLKTGLEQVNPLVIDYYLGWNPDVQSIGRLLIAWVILECEHVSARRNANRYLKSELHRLDLTKYHDDWIRFLIHQIAIHCVESSDLLLNKVSFVTFNYDVSLETMLRNGLNHIRLFSEDDVTKFLSGSRIIHVYGKIREPNAKVKDIPWEVENIDPSQLRGRTGDYHMKMKQLLDAVYVASRGLRVIDPHDKGTDDTEIMIARTVIANVQRVFILGYGFDEHNSGRLNLRATLRHRTELANKRIAFTNYQDINQINKRASKLFYGAPQFFPPGGPAIQDRYEKSTRNTYDALAMDFDLAD
jgi:hypothetical protein